jgi:hypothetical protein
MNVMSCVAAALSAGLSAWTFGVGAACAEPPIPASPLVVASAPTGIGWSWEWDDDDDDWKQTATWECPAGCSITWEDPVVTPGDAGG